MLKTILFFFSCIFCISYAQNQTLFKYDDPRINILGSGWDVLESKTRESLFILVSNKHADSNSPIETMSLPKNVVMVNTPQSDFNYYAEVISMNTNVKDTMDLKFSGSIKAWFIKGSFSFESKEIKQFISNRNSKVTRVFSNIKLAKFILETDQMALAPAVHDRFVQIASLLSKNTNTTTNYAIALADEILRIFGTHYVIEQELGGIISKIDNVDLDVATDMGDRSLSASASLSFASVVSIKGSIYIDEQQYQKYEQSRINTNVHILGGKPWKQGSTYNDWVDTL